MPPLSYYRCHFFVVMPSLSCICCHKWLSCRRQCVIDVSKPLLPDSRHTNVVIRVSRSSRCHAIVIIHSLSSLFSNHCHAIVATASSSHTRPHAFVAIPSLWCRRCCSTFVTLTSTSDYHHKVVIIPSSSFHHRRTNFVGPRTSCFLRQCIINMWSLINHNYAAFVLPSSSLRRHQIVAIRHPFSYIYLVRPAAASVPLLSCQLRCPVVVIPLSWRYRLDTLVVFPFSSCCRHHAVIVIPLSSDCRHALFVILPLYVHRCHSFFVISSSLLCWSHTVVVMRMGSLGVWVP